MSMRPTICVDFDGTICDHEFPRCGALKPGVREALGQFRAQGFRIIIWSCRTCHYHTDVFGGEGIPVRERPAVMGMEAYLAEHRVPYDEIDYGEKGKPLAFAYIDDRGFRFEDNWAQIAAFFAPLGDVSKMYEKAGE